MKNTTFNDLLKYFELLATEHQGIRHNPFEKHFARLDIHEVLTAIPASLHYPALILEGYTYGFNDNRSDNPIKRRSGAFMILDYINDANDFDRIHDAWSRMETIGDDIVCRIRADKRNPESPVRDFNLTSVETRLLAVEFTNLYGLHFTYEIHHPFEFSVNKNAWITPQ